MADKTSHNFPSTDNPGRTSPAAYRLSPDWRVVGVEAIHGTILGVVAVLVEREQVLRIWNVSYAWQGYSNDFPFFNH